MQPIVTRIPSGSAVLDSLLNGGYEQDTITTIYGPAGSGKTNLCMLALIQIAREGKKIIYVDTDGGFSVERLQQIAEDYVTVLEQVVFLRPMTFEEQKQVFYKLKGLVTENIGLIVVDTISMLYRLGFGKDEDIAQLNREMSLQISYLAEIARKKNIPVLLTNQVYADFEVPEKVNMVGGDILKNQSKCLIELQKYHSGIRRAILRRHRSLPEGKEAQFQIVDTGIQEVRK